MTRPFFSLEEFGNALARFARIGITGRPNVGKTTLSRELSQRLALPLYHTDDYIDLVPFKDVPDLIVRDFADRERWILEGVQVSRCLKRGLWPDVLVLVERGSAELLPQHAAMAEWIPRQIDAWPGQVIKIDLDSIS